MIYIKIFTTRELWGDVVGRGKFFFERVAMLYYINVIIRTLHISSFILIYIDILHIVNIVMSHFGKKSYATHEKVHFGN